MPELCKPKNKATFAGCRISERKGRFFFFFFFYTYKQIYMKFRYFQQTSHKNETKSCQKGGSSNFVERPLDPPLQRRTHTAKLR